MCSTFEIKDYLCVITVLWTVWKYINQVPCTMNLSLRNSESFSLSLYKFSYEILPSIIIFLQKINRNKIFMVYRGWGISMLNRMFNMEKKLYQDFSKERWGLEIFFSFVEVPLKMQFQWSLSKADTYGTEVFVRFREVSILERFELKSSQI